MYMLHRAHKYNSVVAPPPPQPPHQNLLVLEGSKEKDMRDNKSRKKMEPTQNTASYSVTRERSAANDNEKKKMQTEKREDRMKNERWKMT